MIRLLVLCLLCHYGGSNGLFPLFTPDAQYAVGLVENAGCEFSKGTPLLHDILNYKIYIHGSLSVRQLLTGSNWLYGPVPNKWCGFMLHEVYSRTRVSIVILCQWFSTMWPQKTSEEASGWLQWFKISQVTFIYIGFYTIYMFQSSFSVITGRQNNQ